MTRPTIDDMLAEIAESVAKRSTCSRLNVGAVIHDYRGVVLSTGYNGALPGMPHCEHDCSCMGQPNFKGTSYCVDICASRLPCDITLHAEANAILWAARRGVATEGSYLFTTHSPCYRCAQLIVQAGIKEVAYIQGYRSREGIELLEDVGLGITQYDRYADAMGKH